MDNISQGAAADVVVAETQTSDVTEWTNKKVGNKMASFSVKKFGEDVAGALACLWGDRMEFFHNCHLEGMLLDGALTPELRAAAPKPVLCEELLASKGLGHPGHVRLVEVLEVEPRG